MSGTRPPLNAEQARLWAWRLHVSVPDVEDLIQDTLLTLWMRQQLDEHGQVEPKTFQEVLRQRRFSMRRTHVRRQQHETISVLGRSDVPTPEDELLAVQAIVHAVNWLLSQVSEPLQRETAVRRMLQDQTFEIIAQEMQVDRSTAYRRWEAAKQCMRTGVERERQSLDNLVLLEAILSALAAVWLWARSRRRRVPGWTLAAFWTLAALPLAVPGHMHLQMRLGPTPEEPFAAVDLSWTVPRFAVVTVPVASTMKAPSKRGSVLTQAQKEHAKALLDQAAKHRRVDLQGMRRLLKTYDLLYPSNPYPQYRDSMK